jgi:hypothetical protein
MSSRNFRSSGTPFTGCIDGPYPSSNEATEVLNELYRGSWIGDAAPEDAGPCYPIIKKVSEILNEVYRGSRPQDHLRSVPRQIIRTHNKGRLFVSRDSVTTDKGTTVEKGSPLSWGSIRNPHRTTMFNSTHNPHYLVLGQAQILGRITL